METRKERSFRIMLLEPDAYVSKSVIKHFAGVSEDAAQAIFDECKKMELKKTPIEFDIRPTKVQKKLVFKVTGIDFNFSMKQYKNQLEERKTK